MRIVEKIGRIWCYLHEDAERWALVRSSVAMILVRMCGVFLAFVASVVMARLLGAWGYGIYTHTMAIAAVLSLPAALGVPQYVVREAAGRMGAAAWLRQWADRRVMVAGVLVAVLVLLVAHLATDAGRRSLYFLVAVVPLLGALSEVRRGLLQANGFAVRSQVAPLLLVPLATLVGLALLWCFSASIDVWSVMVVTVVVATIPLLVNGLQLRFVLAMKQPAGAERMPVVATRTAMRFMWLGGLYLLLSRTDLIMLGFLSSDEGTGVYAVASRAADLVPLLLVAANMVIAPRIAKLYREGNMAGLQQVLTVTMKVVILGSLPVVLFLFLGAGWLLPFFYGETYTDGVLVLRILVVSQFILVLGGPLGTTLEMTGHEKASLIVMAWVVSMNVLLNLALIPTFGANGAAAATCVSVIVGRVLYWRKVRRLVLVRPTAVGI